MLNGGAPMDIFSSLKTIQATAAAKRLGVNAFTYAWDVMPTVLEMAGIPHPQKYRGLYEKAINVGISLAEIKRASNIAGQVKKGAHIALTNCINELTGIEETHGLPCEQTANKSCCG
jgi:hypothetical protein